MSPYPAVELHRHLEGSVRPSRLIGLAAKHGLPEVAVACLDASGDSYLPSGDFGEFLERFKAVCAVLVTPADYHAVAMDLIEDLAAEGVVCAEIIISYGGMLKLGRNPAPIQAALAEAAAAARQEQGIVLGWLPDAVRHFGPDAAWRVLEAAAKAGRSGGVVGFGLGGDEMAAPARDFAEHCAAAGREGLGVAIHAGETAGPESVREAVAVCGAGRIGHGLSASADPEVMKLLAERNVLVELCPGSNLATGVLSAAADHPLRSFLAAGIPCCLNTDDPAIFGLTLRGEYEQAARVHGLKTEEARRMQRQALEASFIDSGERDLLAGSFAD